MIRIIAFGDDEYHLVREELEDLAKALSMVCNNTVLPITLYGMTEHAHIPTVYQQEFPKLTVVGYRRSDGLRCLEVHT